MNERQQIYDRLCETLVEYEQTKHDLIDYIEAAESLYDMLAEIRSKWEKIIAPGTEAEHG